MQLNVTMTNDMLSGNSIRLSGMVVKDIEMMKYNTGND